MCGAATVPIVAVTEAVAASRSVAVLAFPVVVTATAGAVAVTTVAVAPAAVAVVAATTVAVAATTVSVVATAVSVVATAVAVVATAVAVAATATAAAVAVAATTAASTARHERCGLTQVGRPEGDRQTEQRTHGLSRGRPKRQGANRKAARPSPLGPVLATRPWDQDPRSQYGLASTYDWPFPARAGKEGSVQITPGTWRGARSMACQSSVHRSLVSRTCTGYKGIRKQAAAEAKAEADHLLSCC